MLTRKGQVKIMDFGLASLSGRSKLTKSGTTLETPLYMAPEQLEGKKVDRRADIWALGCVLYEMLTQCAPFAADYEQAIAYGIFNEEPEPATGLRSGLPVEIDRVIEKALAKKSNERYQHADELLVDLRFGVKTKETVGGPRSPGPETKQKLKRLQIALAAMAALLTLAIAIVAHLLRRPETTPEVTVRRFGIEPAGDLYADERAWREIMISPNGRHVAYTTGPGLETRLWVQDLDREEAREIAGPEPIRYPIWSPESDFIAFQAGDELKKITVDGGPTVTLCRWTRSSSDRGTGASWSSDGAAIVFSSGQPRRLFEVRSRGGNPRLLFEPDESEEEDAFKNPGSAVNRSVSIAAVPPPNWSSFPAAPRWSSAALSLTLRATVPGGFISTTGERFAPGLRIGLGSTARPQLGCRSGRRARTLCCSPRLRRTAPIGRRTEYPTLPPPQE